MFKFIWIVMLIITVLLFIGYTVYVLYDSYKDAIEYYSLYFNMKDFKDFDNLMSVLKKTLENFVYDHGGLTGIWLFILILGAIILFIASLVVYIFKK